MLHLARWLRPAFAVAIIVAACGLPAPLRADEPTTIRTPEIREMLSQLSQSTDGHVRISYHRSTGMVRFIGSDTDHPITLPDSLGAPRNPIEAALVFLRQFGYLFGLDNPDEQ